MATLMIPTGHAQVSQALQLSGDSAPYYITYGIASPVASGLAETLRGIFVTAWTAPVHTSYSISTCRVRDESSYDEYTANTPGAFTGTALPQNVACLIEKLSLAVGRRNRGRIYMPGVLGASGNVDANGSIQSSRLSQLQTVCTTWLGALTSASHHMVILHSSGTPTPTSVSSLSVDPVVATQRRRLR